jgi:excinuclease ABC subunit C
MLTPQTIPYQPGVYFFKNKNHEILYIGKAKNLKNRISSYFSSHEEKVTLLVAQATEIEWIITSHEIEALLLEAQLIKQHQPLFNRLLKEGNPHHFIFFSEEKIPTISIVRIKKNKGTYYGPFLSKKDALSVVQFFATQFQLKICGKKIPSGCLQYHINLCAGSCTENFDLGAYQQRLQLAKNILDKNYSATLQFLRNQIDDENKKLNFEKSQHLTQFYHHLTSLAEKLTILKTTKYTNLHEIPVYQQPSNLEVLTALKKRLGLQKIPYTIDCFDISHMQGQAIVGSCVRFLDGKPDKKNFRRFMIKSLIEQNDYAALAEIVIRRYRKKESIPDLIIIDGGKGQLNATKNLVSGVEIISLAKREETIFFSDNRPEIILSLDKPSDRLIIQIRDYAHHFAISYHRKKRSLI